ADYEKSKKHLESAYEYYKSNYDGNEFACSDVLKELGMLSYETVDLDKALQHLQEALQIESKFFSRPIKT
ncbi:MAG TPA: tetratricopeptide repeat protein, partial [Nitrososphaera sp.]|nr:tetratricopeptide repeat protein [Nitrososphaera sp.]